MAADVVNLFPSIPHEVGLRALREALHKRDEKTIPTEKLLKIAEFVLTTNYFKFGNKIKQQFAPPYRYISPAILRISTYNV